jgi:hypothetical protein
MNDLFPLLQDLLGEVSKAAVRFLGALLVALLGWLLARIASGIVRRLLRRTGIDKLAERLNAVDLFSRYNIAIKPSAILAKTVYYLLAFIFLVAAADVLDMPAVSDLVSDIINYIPFLISAILVFLLGILLADFLRNTVFHLFESLKVPSAKLISDILFYFLLINVLIISLDQASMETQFVEGNLFILLAGIVLAFAIGYGLASRAMVANFLSALYNKDKIQLGDEITIDGVKGTVVYMDHISVVLKQGADQVVIPLSKLTSERFTLHSAPFQDLDDSGEGDDKRIEG